MTVTQARADLLSACSYVDEGPKFVRRINLPDGTERGWTISRDCIAREDETGFLEIVARQVRQA